MGLFSTKFCDICGEKIGLLGNRKLEDGNICKDCAGKLSPFFSERRSSTIEGIKNQLAYREANKAAVAAFRPTRSLGKTKKVYFDDNTRKFIVNSSRKWDDNNPDVIDLSQVIACKVEVNERKKEIKWKDQTGKEVSYTPPRYNHEYNFTVVVNVTSPWFDEIQIGLNSSPVLVEPPVNPFPTPDIQQQNMGRISPEYCEYEALAEEIRFALTGIAPMSGQPVQGNYPPSYPPQQQMPGAPYPQQPFAQGGVPYPQPPAPGVPYPNQPYQQGVPYPQQPPPGTPYPQQPVQGNPYQQPVQGNPYQQPLQGNPYQQPLQGNPYQQPQQGNPYQQPLPGAPYGQQPVQGNYGAQGYSPQPPQPQPIVCRSCKATIFLDAQGRCPYCRAVLV